MLWKTLLHLITAIEHIHEFTKLLFEALLMCFTCIFGFRWGLWVHSDSGWWGQQSHHFWQLETGEWHFLWNPKLFFRRICLSNSGNFFVGHLQLWKPRLHLPQTILAYKQEIWQKMYICLIFETDLDIFYKLVVTYTLTLNNCAKSCNFI